MSFFKNLYTSLFNRPKKYSYSFDNATTGTDNLLDLNPEVKHILLKLTNKSDTLLELKEVDALLKHFFKIDTAITPLYKFNETFVKDMVISLDGITVIRNQNKDSVEKIEFTFKELSYGLQFSMKLDQDSLTELLKPYSFGVVK